MGKFGIKASLIKAQQKSCKAGAKKWMWLLVFLSHVKITQFFDGWNVKWVPGTCSIFFVVVVDFGWEPQLRSSSPTFTKYFIFFFLFHSMLFAKWYSLICFGHVRFHLWWNSKPKKSVEPYFFLHTYMMNPSLFWPVEFRLRFKSLHYIFWLGIAQWNKIVFERAF